MPQEPTKQTLASPLAQHFLATRPLFLLVSVVASFIGWATAYQSTNLFSLPLALFTVTGAVLIHAAINVFNDYFDALNGTDDNNVERLYPFTGGSRFIQNGIFSKRHTATYGAVLLASGVMIGVGLALGNRPALWAMGGLGVLLGWTYSAPPVYLNGRGLGELSIAIGFGLLIPLGADYIQRGSLHWAPIIAGAPYALLVTNILYIAQFPDRQADAAAGKRHWVVRLDPASARWVYILLALAAFAILFVAVAANQLVLPTLWASLAALPVLFAAMQLLGKYKTPQKLGPAIALTVLGALTYGITISVALVI